MTVNQLVEAAAIGILVHSEELRVHYVWQQIQGAKLVLPVKEGAVVVTLSLVPVLTLAVGMSTPGGRVSPVHQFVFV